MSDLRGEIDAEVEPACASNADYEGEGAFLDVVGDGRGDEGAESEGFKYWGIKETRNFDEFHLARCCFHK